MKNISSTMGGGKYWRKCLLLLGMISIITSCFEEDKLEEPVQGVEEAKTDLDKYIEANFTEEYGIAIRYKFVDNFVDPGQRVTPPKLEVVRPMLDLIEEYWIDVYADVDGGEAYFRRYVPAELVFLGGLIFNGDGTVTLGTADAGARITFTDVNSIDFDDDEWLLRQLHTVYHEFAHIVHQNDKLPSAFEEIAASGYSSAGSWFNLTEEDALMRGFVSPYATSSPNEDFAETIAFYMAEADFIDDYITLEDNCTTAACENRNAGRVLILEKLNAIKEHYLRSTGIDLDELRASAQSRL
ncbi:substrate import-associated zinc metallohydrolase lipoprotein [Reichenbachiella faecimaris]|uniref:Substrate import-associated zinc metallohydrolase lipoprotein n=1 Tax=Reichenbachiella faecimaris TaxID=692418 RepID=A0A1W2G6R2_REIFA|nr:putative zinc-binding metallopeptidase [Reichenbachiella faecimaris]SMD32038.1 substrate import-associated zinc metallohydrolase lipoprotein [Reichenbachiella faecimaris]